MGARYRGPKQKPACQSHTRPEITAICSSGTAYINQNAPAERRKGRHSQSPPTAITSAAEELPHLFGRRTGIYSPAREVILEGKWNVRPATMNTPSPW